MPKESLLDRTRRELELAVEELGECERKFEHWSGRRIDARQEVDRLQAALYALEGKTVPRPTIVGTPGVNREEFVYSEPISNVVPIHVPARPSNMVEINGEQMLLESGFKVAKNSLGEDCIVPDGMPIVPMQEPIAPTKGSEFSFPVVGEADSFDDPKDLF